MIEIIVDSDLTFGQKVRKYRLELELSQEQLAKKLGVCRETIGEYEHDRSIPRTVRARWKLAEILEVSCDELYDSVIGAVAVVPREPIGIGLNFGQLRRSFQKSGGQQLRDWKRMFKYLLIHLDTLTEEDRQSILECIDEIERVRKERRKANRGGAQFSKSRTN